MEKRGSFTGKIGFVLSAAGSAVGLGNIWRFPYLAARHGGGIFLLTYIILALTLGFSLMIGELAIGRKTGKSALGAYRQINKNFGFLGYLCALVPLLVLPYYSVIGGWVCKYLFDSIAGNEITGGGYFDSFIESTSPVFWLFLFSLSTVLAVMAGVEKGVERACKIMMPLLLILSLFICAYVMSLEGAWEGVIYYLKPDFSHFSIETVVSAMGQLFYSMSLSMGIMITYGSYMKKDVSISGAVHQIEFFDTLVAFLSGLMVIPAVFALLGQDKLGQGAGLMFVTMPQVFSTVAYGRVICILFFLLVLCASLTSSISMAEAIVSMVQEKTGLKRRAVCLGVLALCLLLGLPSALGYGVLGGVKIFGLAILDFFDFITNSLLMPFIAILTCILIGYVAKPSTVINEIEQGGKFKMKHLYKITVKYIAPIALTIILASSF